MWRKAIQAEGPASAKYVEGEGQGRELVLPATKRRPV